MKRSELQQEIRKKRFFGRRGFNPLIRENFLFMHRGVGSRSLRMTCKGKLSEHDAGIRQEFNLRSMGFRRNSESFPVKSLAILPWSFHFFTSAEKILGKKNIYTTDD